MDSEKNKRKDASRMKFARFMDTLAQAQLACYAPGVSIYDRYRPRTK